MVNKLVLWTHSHMVITHPKCKSAKFRHSWFCALLFATAIVLWTTYLLLFTNMNFASEIVGLEFQCHQGLLYFFSSSGAYMVILILSGSSTSCWAAVIWQHGCLSCLDTQEPPHCAVPWLWHTVQRPANGFLLWLACLRVASIHVSRFMDVISTEKLVSFVCKTCVHPHSEQNSKSSPQQSSK